MLKRNLKIGLLTVAFGVASLLTTPIVSNSVYANSLDDLATLQETYEKTEDKLLLREMDYDSLLQARAEFDGIGGFFNKLLFKRKKYNELKLSLTNAESAISTEWSKMQSVWEDIQKQIFEIGFAAEQSGDYGTAIEYYKKVQPRGFRERFRIGVCYKLAGNYNEAIIWFRKLNQNRDDVQFEIGSTYALWNKHSDAVNAYSKVVSSFSGSSLEEKALTILEQYESESSFARLYLTIADAYKQKAFNGYDSDFNKAVMAYKKAMEYLARDYNDSAAAASAALFAKASSDLTNALMILDEQNIAAREYYERKLNSAHYNLRQARRSYDEAMYEGAQDFKNSVYKAQRQIRNYADSYNKYVQEGRDEEANHALEQKEYYENRLDYLILNRDTIIYDSADYERRRMNDAEDSYNRVLHNQHNIISDYVAPYKRKVKIARERLDMTNNFNRTAFGA